MDRIFTMLDLEGTELLSRELVPGIYDKLVELIAPCLHLVLYNATFCGAPVSPIPVLTIQPNEGGYVINGGILIETNDYVSAIGIASDVPLTGIFISENGFYTPQEPYVGFNEVDVSIPYVQRGPVYSGTQAPEQSLGVDEEIYIKYSFLQDYDYDIGIDQIYRKVNGSWVPYVEPQSIYAAVRVWTHSTGPNDASMYMQLGTLIDGVFTPTSSQVDIVYNTVQGSNYFDLDIVRLQYPSGWRLTALSDVVYEGNTITTGNVIRTWTYNTSVDFYVQIAL